MTEALRADVDGAKLARREIEVLENLPPHPNVVSFLAASEREVQNPGGSERFLEFALVLEYCSGGSLFDEAAGFKRRGEPYPEARLLRRFRDAALAVAHLHSQEPPICHRDIKPGARTAVNVCCAAALLPPEHGPAANFLLMPANPAGGGSALAGYAAGSVSGLEDKDGSLFVVRLADFGSSTVGYTSLDGAASVGLVEAIIGERARACAPHPSSILLAPLLRLQKRLPR